MWARGQRTDCSCDLKWRCASSLFLCHFVLMYVKMHLNMITLDIPIVLHSFQRDLCLARTELSRKISWRYTVTGSAQSESRSIVPTLSLIWNVIFSLMLLCLMKCPWVLNFYRHALMTQSTSDVSVSTHSHTLRFTYALAHPHAPLILILRPYKKNPISRIVYKKHTRNIGSSLKSRTQKINI